MSKSSSGFSFGWIIFLIIGYNVLFDGNDEKTIEVVEDNTPAVEAPAPESSINIDTDRLKEDAKILLEDAKVAVNEAREDFNKHLEERRKERAKKQVDPPVVEEPPTAPQPEVKAMKPADNLSPPEAGMQKL